MATAPSRHEPLLADGNSKLGAGIRSFSLPTDETCPGATPLCLGICYATRGHYLSPSIQARLQRNLEQSWRGDFAARMIAEIRFGQSPIIRIHVAGDFYDAAYVAKWTRIARGCRRTRFFWYSRSWRVPEILSALVTLAAAPNVVGWWSEDRDAMGSPDVPGIRRAFLVKDTSDEALVDPTRHHLVFRDAKHRRVTVYDRPVKRINNTLVCCYDQWYRYRPDMKNRKEPPKFTCSGCRICFRDGG